MRSIEEILTGQPPLVLSGSASVLEAATAMDRAQVGAVLVTNREEMPLGIFTERDLMTRVITAGKNPAEVQLKEVMSRELFLVEIDRRVHEVAREMQARHIRHLPVVSAGKLVGLLSLRDLLRVLLEQTRNDLRNIKAYIQGEGE